MKKNIWLEREADEFEVVNECGGWQLCVLKMPKIKKRIPADMLSHYLSDGWEVDVREGRTIVLVWTKEGVPQ